jgi:hypothetical protein
VPQNFANPVVVMFAASRSALKRGPLVFFLINASLLACQSGLNKPVVQKKAVFCDWM